MIERDPESAAASHYDMIVIGGGIYGSHLALEATLRGFKTLLLEKKDFGWATSWNSFRIAHGGLRYLQTLDLVRFFQSVRERKWLLTHFPELVKPLPCLMPLYGKGTRFPLVLRIALALNDCLSRNRNEGLVEDQFIPSGSLLSPSQTVSLFPTVETQGLRGSALWHDAVIKCPQRVLMEVLRWAVHGGATCLNYVRAECLISDNGDVQGVEAIDLQSGTALRYSAPVVVNCAGPWCQELARDFDSRAPDGLFHPSLAFNLVLNRRPPSPMALAVQSSRQTLFVLPWGKKTLVGTGHVRWRDQSDCINPEEQQIRQFLREINSAIPRFEATLDQVVRVYAGLLPAQRLESTKLSVQPVFHNHASNGGPRGFFSLSGVKYTTARLVAEKALRQICAFNKERLPEKTLQTRPPLIPHLTASGFIRLCEIDPSAAENHVNTLLQNESVVYMEDLMMRRTDWGMSPQDAEGVKAKVREILGWDESDQPVRDSAIQYSNAAQPN